MTTTEDEDNDCDYDVELSLDERLGEFLRMYCADDIAELAQHYPNEQQALTISWSDLNAYDPDIADDYRNRPDVMSSRMSNALVRHDLPYDVDLTDAQIRVIDLPDSNIHYVGEYRPTEINGTLRGVVGQITKATQVDPIALELVYECLRCGTTTSIAQHGEDPQEPHQCPGCERQGPFRADLSKSTFEDWQKIQLRVPPERSTGSDAKFDVILRGDLTDAATPGDRVQANSTIQFKQKEASKTVFRAYGEAMAVEQQDITFDDIDAGEYLAEIEEIGSRDDPLASIVDSFAPSHYGDERIKEALVLQLFGGVSSTLPDGSTKRGTPHIFLVGDPGSGKTQLMKHACALEPRSVFTMGKTSTAAGLTASAVKDGFGDDQWTLEAGAIVKAHKGLCAVDELDKMADEDKGGLYEAMSDQVVSVNKAGISATLPAETKILAASNPEEGRFDHYAPIAEQIGLDPVLLTRFDLVFTLSDSPDEEHDRAVSARLSGAAQAGQLIERGEDPDELDITPDIPVEVLRAYIAYARDITPYLSDVAAQKIADEYVNIRSANDDDGPIPTTARDITAMHRLSEAAARARLSDTIEVADVNVALRIRRACLADIGIDPETGEFDVDLIETGQSKTQRDRVRSIKEIIQQLMDEHDDEPGAPLDEVHAAAAKQHMQKSKVEHELERLRNKGVAYSPGNDHIRLV